MSIKRKYFTYNEYVLLKFPQDPNWEIFALGNILEIEHFIKMLFFFICWTYIMWLS